MLKEMVVEKNRQFGGAISTAGFFAAALLLSFSSLGSFTAAFCCSIAGAVLPLNCSAVMAGTILTYILSSETGDNGFIICSLILIFIGKWIFRDDNKPIFCGFVTLVSMSFSGIVFGILLQRSLLSVLMNIFIAAVSGFVSFFICRLIESIKSGEVLGGKASDIVSLVITLSAVVSMLCGMSISVLNVGRIIAVIIVLWSSKRFGVIGGSLGGVFACAAITICSPELGTAALFLGLAGLGAGAVSDYSRITISAVFLAVNFCGQLFLGMDDISFCMQADAVLGSFVFLVIPSKILMNGNIVCSDSVIGDNPAKTKMDFAAHSLVDIRNNIEDIIIAIEKNSKPYSAVSQVSTRVCGKCRNKLYCWEQNYERTNNCFLKIDKQKSPESDYFPSGIECLHKREVTEGFARCRKEEAINKMLSARMLETRSILFSQMKTTEDILTSLSDKMTFRYSRTVTRSLERILSSYDIVNSSAIAYYNSSDRLIVEIYTDNREKNSSEEISEILTKELCVPMDYSEPVLGNGEIMLRFNQQTKYMIDFAFSQKSAKESQPSGDCCGFFTDGLGNAYVYISDGMGSGSRAALDSKMVSGLFRRLVKSGIECDAAVKMINTVMLAKSNEESFATLDIGKINLDDCSLTLYKSGAASTLIKYDDTVMMFNSPSNPVGIIPDSKIYQRECSFEEENILVMLSDGVEDNMYKYAKEQLLSSNNLQEIVDNICVNSWKKMKDETRDDVTVAAARINIR